MGEFGERETDSNDPVSSVRWRDGVFLSASHPDPFGSSNVFHIALAYFAIGRNSAFLFFLALLSAAAEEGTAWEEG